MELASKIVLLKINIISLIETVSHAILIVKHAKDNLKMNVKLVMMGFNMKRI